VPNRKPKERAKERAKEKAKERAKEREPKRKPKERAREKAKERAKERAYGIDQASPTDKHERKREKAVYFFVFISNLLQRLHCSLPPCMKKMKEV